MLVAEGIWSGYATGDVLRGVTVRLERGEIVGVIGRNGAGKSTLMQTLIGLLSVRRGTVTLNGEGLTRLPAEQRARRGLGYVPQGRHVFPEMTVLDNLRTGTFIGGGRTPADFDLVHGYFPVLRERARQLAGTLSGGQQEMLAIARALVAGPEVLLLDEPSDGVQPTIVQEIGEAIVDLNRRRGLSVLIVEQNLELMQTVAHRAYVLDKGAIVDTLDHDQVQDASLLAGYLAI
jgi:branched-chain amino acid transport system ATP-binding protein